MNNLRSMLCAPLSRLAVSLGFVYSLCLSPLQHAIAAPKPPENVGLHPSTVFNRSQYNPAILILSFTDVKSASAMQGVAGASFLDITLITRQGEPVGRRVEVSTQQFQLQLRSLYAQIARQESLRVDDPLSPSRQLYQTFIAPVAPELSRQSVSTLLITAERGLQAVPFAALHDGQEFFGERFAFSITPSLQLTSLSPPRRERGDQLAAGASTFQGLAPLPLVPQELESLGGHQKVDRFLNQSFTPSVLLNQAADPQYERVHVATHAEFLPGGPSKSMLYSGTQPVPMDEFLRIRQRRQDKPLELFSLSACRTALGDADSELGFAGLALQAGARSAIGTLWYVDDVATSAFFIQFYRYLNTGYPKAEALKATRIAMASGQIRLQGDQILGPDQRVLLKNLTVSQQRRVSAGMQNPFFWSGIELLGTPW